MKTIDDLKNATKEEVAEALKKITVEEDLHAYLKWLNSNEGERVEVKFKIGHNQKRAKAHGFHPSALSKVDVCKLRLYYDVTGELDQINSFDLPMQMTFDLGTAIHSLLQAHFLEMYAGQFEEEVWLHDEKILINSSHTDGEFNFSDVRFLLEIKSIKEGGNYGWEKIQDRPFPDHVRQVMTYMYLSQCPFGLVFYFCKNNGKIKEHPIVWSEKAWLEILNGTMKPVMDAIDAGKKPLASPGYHCRTCSYVHGCAIGKENKDGARAKRGRASEVRRAVGNIRHRGG